MCNLCTYDAGIEALAYARNFSMSKPLFSDVEVLPTFVSAFVSNYVFSFCNDELRRCIH